MNADRIQNAIFIKNTPPPVTVPAIPYVFNEKKAEWQVHFTVAAMRTEPDKNAVLDAEYNPKNALLFK